jgi:hypothetical protein
MRGPQAGKERTLLERLLDAPQKLLESLLASSPDDLILVRGLFNLARQMARSRRSRTS